MILQRREQFASGLRRPLSATVARGGPARARGPPGAVGRPHDISKAKPAPWPLAAGRQAARVRPGAVRHRPARPAASPCPLFELNWLIGAAPGPGQDVSCPGAGSRRRARPGRATCGSTSYAGKGDLEPLAQVCHRYMSGLDDESIAYAAESLKMLRAELERRGPRSSKKIPQGARPGQEGHPRDRQQAQPAAAADACARIDEMPEPVRCTPSTASRPATTPPT